MSKYKELVYMVLDELKLFSDDTDYTEDHVIFLLDKYRAFLIKQKYTDDKKEMPESYYQTLCLDLEEVPAIDGSPCEGKGYLKSIQKVPNIMPVGNVIVSPKDFYQGIYITYVSRERMRFVGHNKFLKNIIYCSIDPQNYLYFKSSNPQFRYLDSIKFTAVFEDSASASSLQCEQNSEDNNCDILNRNFPIEDALIPPLLELVIKELSGAVYRPKDFGNNAKDDLANLLSATASKPSQTAVS